MSNNLEMKKTVVAGIKEKFEKAQTVVLADYRGLTVAEDTELRNQLRKAGVEYAVLKNTMISRAIGKVHERRRCTRLSKAPRPSRLVTKILIAPPRS